MNGPQHGGKGSICLLYVSWARADVGSGGGGGGSGNGGGWEGI